MLGRGKKSPFTIVPGWETIPEQLLLIKYAKFLQPEVIMIEIGSEYGMSAALLREAADPSIRLFCIEINPKAPFMQNLQTAKLDQNVIPIYGNSQKIDWGILSEEYLISPGIDLLFIDGNHAYEAVLLDLNRWAQFIRLNKWLLLHDVAGETNLNPHSLHHGVKRAVDKWVTTELGKLFKFVEAADSLVVFQRIK